MKLALLIGSGSDINGRRLQQTIDNAKDVTIARINKHYGNQIDIGIKTDIIFGFDTSIIPAYLKQAQFIDPYILDNGRFRNSVQERLGHHNPSTGIMGVYWLLDNDYSPIVIGFGFKNGELVNNIKTYPNGQQEISYYHNFGLENNKLKELQDQGKILLL